MASGAAKDSVVKLGTSGTPGTLVDMSTYVTKIEPKFNGNVIDTTTLGKAWDEVIRGVASGELGIEGIYDPTAGSILFNHGGTTGAVAFEYYPQGTASGKQKYSGSVLQTDYAPPANLDEAVTFAASYKTTGTVSFGTV